MENKEKEIGLSAFWYVFRRYMWWILAALVVGIAAAVVYTLVLAEPRYASTAEFSVDSTNNSANILGSSYQSGMETKAVNIMTTVTGNVFLQQVAENYNAKYGTHYTAEMIGKAVSTSSVSGTSAFRVKVSASDPKTAYQILHVFEEMIPDYLKYVNEAQYNEGVPYYISLIGYGREATVPESPKMWINVMIGGVGLMLLVYVIFFVATVLDKTVYDGDTLKENFSLPVVGEIPEWRKRGENNKEMARERRAIKKEMHTQKIGTSRDYHERLLSKETAFAVTESFKTLRTNLVYTVTAGETPVLGVFSAFSGAGKSLLIANTAISFAQLGKKVVLIDGDMRCPVQSTIFGKDKKHSGLSEYLIGMTDDAMKDCVQETHYEGLSLIACGKIPPNPSELLASTRVEMLLDQLKQQFDYIFIDLPPVCETSDAGVLTRCVTGYIMVIRYGYSNLCAISDSVNAITAVGGKIVGFVFNDIPASTGSYGGVAGKYGKYGKYSKYGSYSKYSKYSKYSRYGRYGAYAEALSDTSEQQEK